MNAISESPAESLSTRAIRRLEPRLHAAYDACDRFGLTYLMDSPRPYSPNTLLGRVITYGPMGAAQPGKPPTNISADVLIVDRLFTTWADRRKRVFLAIFVYRRGRPREEQMRNARVSDAVYERERLGILEAVCACLETQKEKS